MALNATEGARQDLAELQRMITEFRRDLGISSSGPARQSAKRNRGLFRRGLRGPRQARRQAPVT